MTQGMLGKGDSDHSSGPSGGHSGGPLQREALDRESVHRLNWGGGALMGGRDAGNSVSRGALRLILIRLS
jgi:hypothetical protein